MTEFESRTGQLTCTPGEVYEFVTDLRNLRQFMNLSTIDNLEVGREKCSFRFPAVGNVELHLAGKEPFTKVHYSGTALGTNRFSMELAISGNETGRAGVRVKFDADLNPFLKMVASDPIKKFLEELVAGMEKFTGWDKANP